MGVLDETNPSLWVETFGPDGDYPAVSGDLSFDVVVVGGGITGTVAAARLKAVGAKVALVEAGRLCAGATGYTTAKVTALHGSTYASLEKSHRAEAARAYAAANTAGLRLLGELVDTHGLECEWEAASAYTYATKASSVASLEEEAEAARTAGLEVIWTTDTELPFDVAGAIRLDHQAQFHPRRFCLGLARAIEGDGSRVFEFSRVVDVDAGSTCRVTCESGTIEADWVVLATHLPFLDRSLFFAKCYAERSYALALGPVGGRDPGDRIHGMYISSDSPTRSVRSTADGHLIVGGEGHKVGQDPDTPARYKALEAWAAENFGSAEVTHRWSAQDLRSVDDHPFVGRQLPGSNVLVATGFAKWGMTNGAAAALMLSDLIAGKESPWIGSFDATRLGGAITSAEFYKENYDAVGRHLIGDRLKTLRPPPAEELAVGEGGICSFDGDKVAAYRDADGKLHAVSPVCTHVGCLVSFNKAEVTWDCPCHGSRFTVDGQVIEGPALKDLEPKPS